MTAEIAVNDDEARVFVVGIVFAFDAITFWCFELRKPRIKIVADFRAS